MDELWGSVVGNIASAGAAAVAGSVITWFVARRRRAVWVLEHVRGEQWTLSYRGRRPAWDAHIGQTITETVSARMFAGGPNLTTVYGDWVRGDQAKISNFERGEELTLRWFDGKKRAASIQTREGQSRYEVVAAEVRDVALSRMAAVG